MEGAGSWWYVKTHSPQEEHSKQQTWTLDAQAVAERGVPCGIRGCARVEAGVHHPGLCQTKGPRREDAVAWGKGTEKLDGRNIHVIHHLPLGRS